MFSNNDKKYIPEMVKSLPPWAEVIICETKPWNKNKWEITDVQRTADGKRVSAVINYPEGEWRYDHGRNYAHKLATQDWILAIDADERLNPIQWDFLKRTLRDAPDHCGGYFVSQVSWVPSMLDETGAALRWDVASCRIYRRLPPFKWIFPIHEDISPAIRQSGYEIFDTRITLDHLGFMGEKEELKDKLKRNLFAIWRHPELIGEQRYIDYLIDTAVLFKKLGT